MDDEFWAHLLLKGSEFVDADDYPSAVETFEQVARSGHPDAAPKAATLLGQLLSHAGDSEQARALFEYAIASEHRAAAPKSALLLGRLLQEQEDFIGAQQAYGVAALSDVVGVATTAKVAIEQMLPEFEDQLHTLPVAHAEYERARRLRSIDEPDGARAAYRRSIATEDPNYAARSAIELAMLISDDEPVEAHARLRSAIETGHREHAAFAALLLAQMLLTDDQTAEAVEMLESSAAAGTPEIANRANAELAELLVRTERYASAVERFAVLVAEADAETGAHAAFRIGVLLDNLDEEAAIACFRYASDHGAPEIAEDARTSWELIAQRAEGPIPADEVSVAEVCDRAAFARGRIWLSEGALDQAQHAFEAARRSGIPDLAVRADAFLQSVARTTQDTDIADAAAAGVENGDEAEQPELTADQLRTWLTEASPEQLEQYCDSMMATGYSHYEKGDVLGAVRSWERAASTGHLLYAPRAIAQIAAVFWLHEGISGASGAVGRLEGLGYPDLMSRAWFFLALRLASGRAHQELEGVLRRAAEGDARPAADCVLRVLRNEQDEIVRALAVVEDHTPDLVPEVLRFAMELAEARKRDAADAYRTAELMSRIGGSDELAEEAEQARRTLSD